MNWLTAEDGYRGSSSPEERELTSVLRGVIRREGAVAFLNEFEQGLSTEKNSRLLFYVRKWAAMKLPIGSFVKIEKQELQSILLRLHALGYRTIGPRLADSAIVYDDIRSLDDLPKGYVDEQDGGRYRVVRGESGRYFDYVVGPHSLKQFLFPPRETVLEAERRAEGWQFHTPELAAAPLAVLGPRACDLNALAVQDRIFQEGAYVDTAYQTRRAGLFLIAVNCRRAAATCFCHSMKTGPKVKSGFDLALTELEDCFVIEVGTDQVGRIIRAIDWEPCSMNSIRQAQAVSQELEQQLQRRTEPGQKPRALESQSSAMPQLPIHADPPAGPRLRSLQTHDLRELLLSQLDHPHWQDVAERCVACGNCTMVCPTCFCSSVTDVSDLTGDHVRRERQWTSCFTAEHSYMNSGVVRKTTASRYRQWLTHKLATWIDQFGTSGCVGCGRCITWCPVGIDLTAEVAAIRGETT